jgi:hypothetical protein
VSQSKDVWRRQKGELCVRPFRKITDNTQFPGGDLQDFICNACQENLDVILKGLIPVLI